MSIQTPGKWKRIREGYRRYRFELRHIAVLVLVLISFQFIALYINQQSLEKSLTRSQQWYQQDAAERIANLMSSSLEMLLESKASQRTFSEGERHQIIQDFNIIFSQQLLDRNVRNVCVLIPHHDKIVAINDGKQLFGFFFDDPVKVVDTANRNSEAVALYQRVRDTLSRIEQVYTIVEQKNVFHVFIPFVPRGEVVGVVYMKASPDLSSLTLEMSSNYSQTIIVYSSLIVIGLLAMFYISIRTVEERNEIQRLLFEEQKRRLTEEITHKKELLFTKRIYHTHHKAEKIGGFIKEDLRNLRIDNIESIRNRISKYASFIARVIYDMKWYEPPLHTIRGPMFKTDMNEVIRFMVENIFKRISDQREAVQFVLELDEHLPPVAINEYSIWEALEPIIQNSLDHSGVPQKEIAITTLYKEKEKVSIVTISDNGHGILPELLEHDSTGIKKIFQEHVTSGFMGGKEHSGYGCFIAYELATQRFGWKLDAENRPEGGSRFTVTIQC
jgi:signal transduction histidine kinase